MFVTVMGNDRPGFPVDRIRQVFGIGDDDFLPACVEELKRRLDLRFHASFLELGKMVEQILT
jgi:hypothetical protein